MIQRSLQHKYITSITSILFCALLGIAPLILEASQSQDSYVTSEFNRMTTPDLQKLFYSVEINEKIRVELNDEPIETALGHIGQLTGFKLTYRADLLPDKKITLEEDVSVTNALAYILDGTDLGFSFHKNGYLLISSEPEIRNPNEGLEQAAFQETITGQVTDAQTREALPGVNIILQGTNIGTTTNIDGNYNITVPSLNETLVFSYVGYLTKEIPIDGRSEVAIALEGEVLIGDELIVVGYGTQRRDDITGSVRQLQGAKIAEQPSVQTSAALMGKFAGLQVIENSGQPGQNHGTLRIRGTGTLGNSNPLVLIDGVQGNLDDVASSDIESVTVLKDAAAAAVYGSRAANGVILVTTRRGQQDQIRVNYRGYLGWQQPTNQPKMVDGGTFMKLQNQAAMNVGQQRVWSESYIQEWEANHESDPDNYPNTDWVDLVFSEPAFQQQQRLDLSGGTDAIRYFGSLTYDEENGNVPNFNFKRYAIRLNTDVNASQNLSFNIDLNVQSSDQLEPVGDNVGQEGILIQSFRLPPVAVAKFTNGGWGFGWNGQNPVAFANAAGTKSNETSQVNGRLKAIYLPTESLEFELMYAPKFRSSMFKNMSKQYEVVNQQGEVQGLFPLQNSLFQQYVREFTHNINFIARHQQYFGNHNLNLLGGYEFIEFRNDMFQAMRDNFVLQDYEQLNAGSSANQQNAGTGEEWAIQSLFSRFNYDYGSKYLFEANIRYDGSSRFSEGNRWGLFPSFSGGWVISEESFMESVDLISSLKVRASWGKLGNQQIGTYPYMATVDLGQNFLFGDNIVPGAGQLDLANVNISWEETTTRNIGLDASLFEDRFYLAFDIFERNTSDILLTLPIPLIIGLNPPFQNAGAVKNTGWELETGYSGNFGDDFYFSLSLQLSDVKNEVTDLKGVGPFISGSSIIQEGYPINAIYGFESDGLFQTEQEIDNHSVQSGQIAPGDLKYVDQDRDGVISADDRVVIGDPFPSMNYGINISANYKNFDLSAFIQGVGSRDVILSGPAVYPLWLNVKEWQAADVWTPENPDATLPRLTPGYQGHSNHQASDFWVFDASYLRLRNLQIGYSLPSSLTNQLSIRNARIFFLGQNLLTLFDNMPPGIDPNVPSGTGGNYFPINRLLSSGIHINF